MKFESNKKTFYILNRNDMGENIIDAKKFEDIKYEYAAEQYANYYFHKNPGEWNIDDEIEIDIFDENRKLLTTMFIYYYYRPIFHCRERCEDDE